MLKHEESQGKLWVGMRLQGESADVVTSVLGNLGWDSIKFQVGYLLSYSL